MVFKEVAAPNSHKVKSRHDLENELGLEPQSVRENEGEAAEYGVYFDDTEYDYMQHMRDLGQSTEAYFVEAPSAGSKDKKGKGKQKLEDALRLASLEDEERPGDVQLGNHATRLGEEVLPSKDIRRNTYQDQQDVPDALAGFQPDMDPRLREVLEALEDEAYVDDEEDVFEKLAQDREEVSVEEFQEQVLLDEDGDEGWETDDTAKPQKEYKYGPALEKPVSQDANMHDDPVQADGDWMAEFAKYKNEKRPKAAKNNPDFHSSVVSGTSSALGGRHKKRKGAMTSSTGYSMTSSSLFRTEGLTLLDDRFEKIEEQYAEEDGDNMSMDDSVSMVSTKSQHGPIRSDFDSIMDDFLSGYSVQGKRKKRLKKGGAQTGIEELDEIRRGLGPARVVSQKV